MAEMEFAPHYSLASEIPEGELEIEETLTRHFLGVMEVMAQSRMDYCIAGGYVLKPGESTMDFWEADEDENYKIAMDYWLEILGRLEHTHA